MKNLLKASLKNFRYELTLILCLVLISLTSTGQTWQDCNEMILTVDDFNTTLDFENQPADCGCSTQGECTLVRIRLVETINGVETLVSTAGIGFMPPLGNDSEPNQISKDYVDLFDPYFSPINCTEYQANGGLDHNYMISPVAPAGQEFHVLVCPGSEAGVRNGRFFLPPGDPSPTIAAPTNVTATDGEVQTDVSFGTIPGKYYMAFRNSENCNDTWVKIDGNSNWPQATSTTMTIRDQQGSTYGNEYEYRVVASDFAFNPATTAAGIWSAGDLGHGGALLQAYDTDNSCTSSGSDCANDTEAPTCSDLDVTIVGDVSDGFATVDFNLLFTDNCDIDLEINGANSTTGLEITETDIVPCGETIEYIMLATDDNLNQETCTFNVTADCGDNPTDLDTCLVETAFSNLLWSSYLGGDGEDEIVDIFVDENTDIHYVLGKTTSTNFYSTNPEIGTSAQGLKTFVMAINPDASLNWSTILNGWDDPQAIHMDPDGYLTLVGITDNTMLPGAAGLPGYDKSHNGGKDILILKIDSDGQDIVYSSFYGGNGNDFDGSTLTSPEFEGLKVDFNGTKILILGSTESNDLPLKNEIDANPGLGFATVLNINLNSSILEFSTYFKKLDGGITSMADGGVALLINNADGDYSSLISSNAIEPNYTGFYPLPLLLVLRDDYSIQYATYIGPHRVEGTSANCEFSAFNGTPGVSNLFDYELRSDDCGNIYWYSQSAGFRQPFISSEFLLPARKYRPALDEMDNLCEVIANNPLLKINMADESNPFIEYMLFFGYGGVGTTETSFDIDDSGRLHIASRRDAYFSDTNIVFPPNTGDSQDLYFLFENDLSDVNIKSIGPGAFVSPPLPIDIKVYDNKAYLFGSMTDVLSSVTSTWTDEDGNANSIIQSSYGSGVTDGFISVIDNNELCAGCQTDTTSCSNTVLHFDGVDDRVIGNSPLMGNSDYTISLDFKGGPQNNGSYPRLISFTSFETEIAISGTELAYYNGNTWINSAVNVADNSWHNVVLVRSSGQNVMYLDGILIYSSVSPATLNFMGSMAIGGKASSANENFEGLIDNVKVWDTPLDSMEICDIVNLNPKALHYDFEIGNGGEDNTGIMEIPDLLGSNNGTPNNFSLTGDVSNLLCEEYEIGFCPSECDLDTTPPLVACPIGIDYTFGLINGRYSPILSDFDIDATDDCKLLFEYSPDSFDCDDLGINQVIVTVSDEAGNSATCQIEFTLFDNNFDCSIDTCNNTAMHFDGLNDRLTADSPLVGNSDYSISIDFNCGFQLNGTYPRIIGFTGFEAEIAVKGSELAYYNGSGWTDSGVFVADNLWHNVVIVRENMNCKMYLDGLITLDIPAPATLNFTQTLNIGANSSGTDEFFNGLIDNVKIWNYGLSQTEVCGIQNESPNTLYYDFEGGFGGQDNSMFTTVSDLVGEEQNGTLTNFSLTEEQSNYVCNEIGINSDCIILTDCCGDLKLYGDESENTVDLYQEIGDVRLLLSRSNDGFNTYAVVTRLDDNNNVIWQNKMEEPSQFLDFEVTEDDDIILVGRTTPVLVGQTNQCILGKLNGANGSTISMNRYDFFGRQTFGKIVKHDNPQDLNFPFYIVGVENGNSGNFNANDDIILLNVNENCDIKWAKVYEKSNDNQWQRDMISLADGNLLLIGDQDGGKGVLVTINGLTGNEINVFDTDVTMSFNKAIINQNNLITIGRRGIGATATGMIVLHDVNTLAVNDMLSFANSSITNLSHLSQTSTNAYIATGTMQNGLTAIVDFTIINNTININKIKYLDSEIVPEATAVTSVVNQQLLFAQSSTDIENQLGGVDILLAQFNEQLQESCLQDTILNTESNSVILTSKLLIPREDLEIDPPANMSSEAVEMDCISLCKDTTPPECTDQCQTDMVDLSTGVDFIDGSLLPIGEYDGGWVMVSGPDAALNYPQPGFVLTPDGAWSDQLNAQFISPFANTSNNMSFSESYTFERQFCICQSTEIQLDIAALFDNFIDVGLYDEMGNLIQQLISVQSNSVDNFQIPSTSNTTHQLLSGVYSLRVGLRNDMNVSMGMAIEASLSGAGLIESGCCSPYQYITGTVFEDMSCDTIYNLNSDPVISDIVISLCDANGQELQQSNTDVQGFYTFFDVDPGTYIVKQAEIGDLTITLGSGGYELNIEANTVSSNVDFGNCSDLCVVDMIDPTCNTQNIVVSLDQDGAVTIMPEMIDNGSSDECSDVTLSIDINTFSCTDIGENTVVLTVIDEAGNTATCDAFVTIEDKLAPICNTQDITVELSSDGEVNISAIDIDAESSDNCSFELSIDQETFTCSDLGEQFVTLTVSDGTNEASCTAVVTVLANESICDPTCLFLCTEECSTETVDLSTGINTATGSFLDIGDYDSNWTLIFSPDPGIQVPRPAFVLNPNPAWDNLTGSQYVSAYPNAENNASNIANGTFYEFEKCFCVCDDSSEVVITLAAYVDNNLEILLYDSNGLEIQSLLNISDTTSGAFSGDPEETETTLNLENGIYCLRARLKNDAAVTMGMSIEAMVDGIGLIENQCCKTYNAITGIVFNDINCDGSVANNIDVGISNWDIQLCASDGTVIEILTTDSFGYFSFNNIPPGEYIAKALNPNENINSTDIEFPVIIDLNEVISVDFGFCDTETSVDEASNSDNFVSINPLPFSKSLIIEFNLEEHNGFDCQIINSVGQVLQSFEVERNRNKYDLKVYDIPSGMYYIKFKDKLNHTQFTKRILKF